MHTDPHSFEVGSRVCYDEARGTVLRRITGTGRTDDDDYEVEWQGGGVSTVWGSDLVHDTCVEGCILSSLHDIDDDGDPCVTSS